MKRRFEEQNEEFDVRNIDRYVIKGQTRDADAPHYSSVSRKLMNRMGHIEGTGLGSRAQGRAEPVEASSQKGKAGVGYDAKGIEESNDAWDIEEEKKLLYECEKIFWFRLSNPCPASIPKEWLVVGEEKLSLDDEFHFCKKDILAEVLRGKSFFDDVKDARLFRTARDKSNLYELTAKSFFLNRASMKVANIDSKFNFFLTNPKRPDKTLLVEQDELFSFADVCAGPGGFSEYVLWRSSGLCKGFGLTLKDKNDFKLNDFKAGPSEMFEPYYGETGDGDIYNSANQSAFREFVMSHTQGRGVHLVMADGGFSVEGNELIQEILSHRLYLCQAIMALLLLRPEGNFICKVFDLFTPFSCGLIFLLTRCFRQLCIFKPVTSRPANSERYLVCTRRLPDVDGVLQHLLAANQLMQQLQGHKQQLRQLVPMETMQADESFMRIMSESNKVIGFLQCISLRKLAVFLANKNLQGDKEVQMQIQMECQREWGIPCKNNLLIPLLPSLKPEELFKLIMNQLRSSKCLKKADDLSTSGLQGVVKSRRDHVICALSSPFPCLLIAFGRNKVYKLVRSGWEEVYHLHTNLPAGTILEVDIVEKMKEEFKFPKIHAIDLIAWAGKIKWKDSFHNRRRLLSKLLKAANKSTLQESSDISFKRCHPLQQLDSKLLNKLLQHVSRDQPPHFQLPLKSYDDEDDDDDDDGGDDDGASKQVMEVWGVHVVRTTKPPWITCFSKKQQCSYYYNLSNGSSTYEKPEETSCNYFDTTALTWKLSPQLLNPSSSHKNNNDKNDNNNNNNNNNDVVTKDIFLKHIASLP